MNNTALKVIDMSDAQAIHITGRDVLNQEATALKSLASSLGDTFDEAVALIGRTKGRLIVSGVGKSGHVGHKMAATFASTGQPAFFVHAAEAGHGDLGMITKDDTLLLISYSGEAKELHAMLNYAHRFELPVISITARPSSVLAQHSTLTLLLPDVGEACPMGLAPTTSTTLTMALGDALAVSLLTLRGFTKQDFHTFHPGGNLGSKLQSIQDFMHKGDNLPLIDAHANLAACLDIISKHKLGCVGIADGRASLLGVITDGDIRRLIQNQLNDQQAPSLHALCAKDVMTVNPLTIADDALLGDALALFEKKSITNLFVLKPETSTVVGVLHLHDCLKGKAI